MSDHIKVKISFIGDSGVGKTMIINRILNKKFCDTLAPTIGVYSFPAKLKENDVPIFVSLNDTSGQEKFRAITPQHIRDSDIVCIVASITSYDSINSIDFWLKFANEYCQNGKILLLINKMDIEPEKLDFSFDEIERRGLPTFRLSAKDIENYDYEEFINEIKKIGLEVIEARKPEPVIKPVSPQGSGCAC